MIKNFDEFINESKAKYVKLPDGTITIDSHFMLWELQDKIDKVLTSLNTNLFADKKRIEKRGGTVESLLKIIQEKIDKILPGEFKIDWNTRVDNIEKQEASEELSNHKDKNITDNILYACYPLKSSKYEIDKCYILIKIYPWWTFDGFNTDEFWQHVHDCGYRIGYAQWTEIHAITHANTDVRTNPDARNYEWL